MHQHAPIATFNSPIRSLIGSFPGPRGFVTVILAFITLTLPQAAHGVNPAPDGGYANQNTAEGDGALFKLTTGRFNTAVGFDALFNNTTGFNNTATGSFALNTNTTGGENTATGFEALTSNTT